MRGSGGAINAGPRLALERPTNQGTLAVAGSGHIGATEVTGVLLQQGSGVLAIDLDLNRGSLALRAEGFGSFSSNTTTYGGGVSLAMGF